MTYKAVLWTYYGHRIPAYRLLHEVGPKKVADVKRDPTIALAMLDLPMQANVLFAPRIKIRHFHLHHSMSGVHSTSIGYSRSTDGPGQNVQDTTDTRELRTPLQQQEAQGATHGNC